MAHSLLMIDFISRIILQPIEKMPFMKIKKKIPFIEFEFPQFSYLLFSHNLTKCSFTIHWFFTY